MRFTHNQGVCKNKYGFLFKEPLEGLILDDWAKTQLGFEFKKYSRVALPSWLENDR